MTTNEHDSGRPTRSPSRLALSTVGTLLLLTIGVGVALDGADSVFVRWLPWLDRTNVTFFFADDSASRLVPVSRTVSREETTHEALLDALLNGPADGSGLVNLIPSGTVILSSQLTDGALQVDLGGTYSEVTDPLVHEALLHSLRSWPGVAEVSVTIHGAALATNSSGHLLFFYDRPAEMLVAFPTNRVRPVDVLDAWLSRPLEPDLVGLPPDVESLGVELGSNELLTLRFTFRESLREMAVDDPQGMRRVLEGLIATFSTGFPEIGGVMLDFEGRNALGLGQCANLLNTVQQMPEVLNDERLLVRTAEAG